MGLMLLLAEVAGPSSEATENAARAVTESNVFGAAFIVVLGVLVSVLAVLFFTLRSRDKQHAKERKEMREEFISEREQLEETWDARFEKYSNLLDKQTEAKERAYTELGTIQEKRVQQAMDTIEIAKDGHNKIDQLVELIKASMVIEDGDDA
jgi:hypothetical protein